MTINLSIYLSIHALGCTIGVLTYVVVIGDKARALVVDACKIAMRATHVTVVNILTEFIGLAVHCQNISYKNQKRQ